MKNPDQPITPLSLAILLALADEALHGYALMKAVEEQTEGAIRPGTGTLYAALDRLMEDALIQDGGLLPGDRRRGRSYIISTAGREAARSEIARLQRIVVLAGERDLTPDRAG